jgi:hypothetical protein
MLLAAALTGMAGVGMAHPPGEDAARAASLEQQVAQLKRQSATLHESLLAANQREKESADSLARIRLRLEALGKNLVDGGDDRLVQAVSDLEVLKGRIRELEETALRLSGGVQAYLKTAVVADPDARATVEARLRELEALVGLRNRPQVQVDLGNLKRGKVVSIDSESGLLVLNVGEQAGARIGMIFKLQRGERLIGEAVVAETRDSISGLLIQHIEDETNPVRLGDIAALKVE